MTTSRHRYDYDVSPDSATASAHSVLRFVGHGKRVLEVGSGPGAITRLLKEQNDCRVVAVEIDEAAALLVTPFCERVLNLDLNSSEWSARAGADGKFDVVLAADVLEHLSNPLQALRQIAGLLAEGGRVVVSLPHAGHNAVIASLLNSDVAYGDFGLLDRTHLHWFGLHNMQRLLNDAGLKIIDAQFVARPPLWTELASQWSRLPAHLRKALEMNPYGSVYQVVILAAADATGTGGISLLDLPAPGARGTILERVAGPMRARMSRVLSSDAKARIKHWLRRVGFRV